MPTFRYVVKDASGKKISGKAPAADKNALIANLRKQNMLILSVSEEGHGPALGMGTKSAKVKSDELAVFSRQLATIINAGVTVVGGLDILSEQMENQGFKQVLIGVKEKVEAGSNLSSAMKEYPKVFSTFFVNMIVAGEGSGMLDEILDRVATYLEKTASLQRKIKSALVYPAIVSLMATGITVLLLVKVVPTFAKIFEDFGADLPLPTQILLSTSNFVKGNLILMMVFVVGAFFGLRFYANTNAGALNIDRIKLKLPVFGKLFRKVAISRFSRTLSTLTKSGVPILSSLEIVAKTAGNRVVENAITSAKDSIREGENIADPLAKSGIFPPLVTRMISVGEHTGQLETMLSKIADFYEDEVDTTVAALTSLMEPLIIAFLGIVIGGIVIAMFMPMFQMTQVMAG